MSAADVRSAADTDAEMSALIATLHETGQRLEELTAGEVDTVANREGRTFVLQRAQEQIRYVEAGKQAAILNALPAHIALLDALGVIVSVNQSWRRFAGENALQPPGDGVGLNYLAACDDAQGDDALEARRAAAGIRAVLAGDAPEFSMEYPCHAPGEQRWFLMTATPLAAGRSSGAVVMHVDISARKRAEADLETTHKQLLLASRQSGMAEVAASVLHNVGNVLNSVNVSASLVVENLKNSRADSMARVAALLAEHQSDLAAYITHDPKGQHIPAYLQQLSQDWLMQQRTLIKELESLRSNIDHIKSIVAMQQSYARVSGTSEIVDLGELVEDALRMEEDALLRHHVQIVREIETAPPVTTEKHKILQILVNLLRNAKHACGEHDGASRIVTVRVAQAGSRVRISVSDTGVGIAAGNLTRIFSFGFTTRKHGHGFGLHSSALAAAELGGSLTAHSDGPGMGATFTLELPVGPAEPAREPGP
jgi:signal transduction histidine kinase